MILLDTHVIVWLVTVDRRLGKAAAAAILTESDRIVSAMASWEIAMRVDKRRITIDKPLSDWLRIAFESTGVTEVPVTGDIAQNAGSLPGAIHGDPCDRIMIATARAMDCPLLTADEKILRYAAEGHLKAIDARR